MDKVMKHQLAMISRKIEVKTPKPRRFPDHGVVVVWVGPWLGLICVTHTSWGSVEPNATGLPSETLLKRPGSSQRNPCRGIFTQYSW